MFVAIALVMDMVRRLPTRTSTALSSFSGQVSELYGYDSLNLLSCMILDVDNIHSVVHLKDPHSVELREKLWKCSQGRLKEDNPLGGVPLYKSEVFVCCTRTCHDPVSHTNNSTVPNCTDGTTEPTEDEGLGASIWRCGTSAFCQTRDNKGKSWNSPIVPLSERNSAG